MARLRPVLLTTVTTVGGLIPLAFFATGQAKLLSPMAISVVWGLSFATILTLILIPCLYAMLDDLAAHLRHLTGIQVPNRGLLIGEDSRFDTPALLSGFYSFATSFELRLIFRKGYGPVGRGE